MVNKYDLHMVQRDLNTAFLNWELDKNEEILMEIPDGYNCYEKMKQTKVYKLKYTLYSLKISPKWWNEKFSKVANKLGLKNNDQEPYLFTAKTNRMIVILLLYVDDMLIASNYLARLNEVKRGLNEAFKMTDLGEPKNFLDMNTERRHNERVMVK